MVFVEVGKPENPEKNPQSKARTNNKLKPDMAPGKIQIEKNLGTKC